MSRHHCEHMVQWTNIVVKTWCSEQTSWWTSGDRHHGDFIYLLKAYPSINRTGSPQGYSLVQTLYKSNNIQVSKIQCTQQQQSVHWTDIKVNIWWQTSLQTTGAVDRFHCEHLVQRPILGETALLRCLVQQASTQTLLQTEHQLSFVKSTNDGK